MKRRWEILPYGTTGHMSFWNMEECIAKGAYMQGYVSGEGTVPVDICHYPGRSLNAFEWAEVTLAYERKNYVFKREAWKPLEPDELRECMNLAQWQEAAQIDALRDEYRRKKLTEVLTTD